MMNTETLISVKLNQLTFSRLIKRTVPNHQDTKPTSDLQFCWKNTLRPSSFSLDDKPTEY